MKPISKIRLFAVSAVLPLFGAACAPDAPGNGGVSTTTTTIPTDYDILAIGDSNASGSNDPLRGLPWSERLGATARNGSNDSQGAGYVTKGTFTNRTFAEELVFENTAVPGATIVVTQGGVNDTPIKTVAEIEAGMIALKDAANANGQEAYFVKIIPTRADSYVQPYEYKRVQINNDLDTLFPGKTIDCEADLDTNGDGYLDSNKALDPIHLSNAGEQALADCIKSGLGI